MVELQLDTSDKEGVVRYINNYERYLSNLIMDNKSFQIHNLVL